MEKVLRDMKLKGICSKKWIIENKNIQGTVKHGCRLVWVGHNDMMDVECYCMDDEDTDSWLLENI